MLRWPALCSNKLGWLEQPGQCCLIKPPGCRSFVFTPRISHGTPAERPLCRRPRRPAGERRLSEALRSPVSLPAARGRLALDQAARSPLCAPAIEALALQTPRPPSRTGETSCISSLDQLSICLQLVFIIVIASVTGTKLKQSNGDCYLNLLPGAVCECVPLPLPGLRASSLGLPAVVFCVCRRRCWTADLASC